MRRTKPRGRANAQATTARTSAGASTGAHAVAAAKSSEAAADALHERAPSIVASTSHGSSRCRSTALGRPSDRAARNGGASIQSRAASTGGQRRSLNRVAHHQAPRAANGSAVSQSSTSENDGSHGVTEPSRATTATNGSAGPVSPYPTPRIPHTTRDQSVPTLPSSGSSAPPAIALAPRSLQNRPTPTTAATSVTAAPPPPKNGERTRSGSPSPAARSRAAVRSSRT